MKEEKRKKTYEWFIEPLNAETNAAFADYLNFQGEKIDLLLELKDKNDKVHSCYRVPFSVANHIYKLKLEYMKFTIYNRDKNSGPIKKWVLFKKKSAKKVLRIKEDIKNLKKR